MIRALKFLSLSLLFTAFSCTKEKAVSVSLENPFRSESFLKLRQAPAKPYLKLQVLGDLQSQLTPCQCFMRPNGGLERIENYFTKRKDPSLPLISLGGFWSPWQLEVKDSAIQLDLVADFLSQAKFDAVLLSSKDLDFLRAYKAKVSEKVFNAYLARVAPVKWVIPVGLSAADQEMLKPLQSIDALPAGPRLVGFVEASGALGKSEAALLAKAVPDEALLVLTDVSMEQFGQFEPLVKKAPLVLLSSTHDFNRATLLPRGSLLTFLTERRSRSIGELVLWDKPVGKSDVAWLALEPSTDLIVNWEYALQKFPFKDRSSLAAMQKEFDASDTDEKRLLESELDIMKTTIPESEKTILRNDVHSVDLTTDYDGKTRLSERLKKITPADAH